MKVLTDVEVRLIVAGWAAPVVIVIKPPDAVQLMFALAFEFAYIYEPVPFALKTICLGKVTLESALFHVPISVFPEPSPPPLVVGNCSLRRNPSP